MMEVTDISLKTARNRINNPLLPSSLRALICGRSNAGKSILLFNLLLKDGWLDYNHLFVFGNSLFQSEYELIKKGYEHKLRKSDILNLFQKDQNKTDLVEGFKGVRDGDTTVEFFDTCEEIPDPKSLDKNLKNLLILDDCYLGKQNTPRSYFSRGKHSNCDVIYLTQNYFTLARNSVRENANFIIFFPQNAKSVEHIYRDHCSDLPFIEFKELCEKIWAVKYNFLTIDLTASHPWNGKYRQNLDQFYIPKRYNEEIA